MVFFYADSVLQAFPELVSAARRIDGLDATADAAPVIAGFQKIAQDRLALTAEGEFPEIQAWRRAFSKMGLKPTQYRCAAEALLRRYRKENSLPAIHPMIDLCNAISLAFAIPVAVFDLARVAGRLQVRFAEGSEIYHPFTGEPEHPGVGEVIFADDHGQAHARRWTHRQSSLSAVRDETFSVLVVAEAMHDQASRDICRLITALEEAVFTLLPAAIVASESAR